MKTSKCLKVKLIGVREDVIYFDDKGKSIGLKSPFLLKELNGLGEGIKEGAVFNLLNVEENREAFYSAEFIVFEPDYLLDISALSACFKTYGKHPLNYVLSRFSPKANTMFVLLGNIANNFIDVLVNDKQGHPSYRDILSSVFRSSPFEFSSCGDLKNSEKEKLFFKACRQQFENIKKMVEDKFSGACIDKEKIVLEPSFISMDLGLQGRLDMMSEDYSSFVELKSGRASEHYPSGQFIQPSVSHYIQMILYLAVLEFNLGRDPDSIQSYLLYSRYPVMCLETHSRRLLTEAIRLRNRIVALIYRIQQHNDISYTKFVLKQITSDHLNQEKQSDGFFNNFFKPSIDRFGRDFDALSELEESYFLRLYNFIEKELWMSKAGLRETEGGFQPSNMWNVPFEEKKNAGEIMYRLKIRYNSADSKEHFIVLAVPRYEEDYLPNFRQGDAVVLYERNDFSDSVNNKQVFRGTIEDLSPDTVKIRIRARQRNLKVFHDGAFYALEHDYMDNNYNHMFRALDSFVQANKDRRDLLLGQRNPNFETYERLDLDEDVDRAMAKAFCAKDCFLLIGPPGTGKTSVALKKMVEAFYSKGKNLLLVSYTNRAVDEICKSLASIVFKPDFIRIGSELNCAPEYRSYLLEKKLEGSFNRKDVLSVLSACRIFVGTASSVWSNSEVFNIKHFEVALIDEATQLLESHLLGILTAKNPDGKNAVGKFILLGDQKQLPAVVLQSEEDCLVKDESLRSAGFLDLSVSMFERLYMKYKKNNLSDAYDFLSLQGRMHPDILAFPSKIFYNNRLKCLGLPHQKESLPGIPSEDLYEEVVFNRRLAFFQVESISENSSKTNVREAAVVSRISSAVFKYYIKTGRDFTADTLGIITPYRNQIAMINNLLKKAGIPELFSVQVDTVERFQGSQKDIIIYSVCQNSLAQFRTLPNLMVDYDGTVVDRKLNVVLTRARKQFFVVGDAHILKEDRIYGSLIDHIAKYGSILQV